MQSRRFSDISMISAIVALMLGFSASPALAATTTCVDDGDVEVCAEWSGGAAPKEGNSALDNFYVVFNGGIGAAAVELITGDLEWRLWTTEVVSGDVMPFRNITLKSGNNGDFNVRIYGDSEAGAAGVGSIHLDATTGYSSIWGLSLITGDLGGLTLVQDDDDNGGVMEDLIVFGKLTGPLTVPTVKGIFNAFGAVDGDADVTIGEVDAGKIKFASLLCDGAVCPDLTVTGKVFDGTLEVTGDVPSGSTVKIEELEEASPQTGITLVSVSSAGNFVGTLHLPNGLANAHTKIQMGGLFSGVMDLGGGVVAEDAEINVYFSTAAAVIKNVGAVSGDIYVVLNIPGQDYTYAGTVTVDSVTSTGEIATTSLSPGIDADFAGTITVNGVMAGLIEIIGDLRTGALIEIIGDLTGDIDIEGDMFGDVDIEGDMTGDVDIGGDLTGSLTIEGALDNTGASGGGRILVAGLVDGPIKIHDETDTLTLIHLLAGLDDNGSIEINSSEGAFSAEGDIVIGLATCTLSPPDVTFNGCIRIYDDSGSGHGGDLDGAISVCGCHATADDLNICIDGDDNGNVTISQAGCANQVDWSCNTCP